MIRKPSAWIPIALSLVALAAIIAAILILGVPTPQDNKDEGVGAHLFQIWLVLEVFMVGFFAVKWLPRAPSQAFLILIVQVLAVLAACFPVFFFHL